MQPIDFPAGVHNGRVVSAAQMPADFLQTVLSELSGKIHTNLTRLRDALAAFFALQVRRPYVEVPRHNVDDVADFYAFRRGLNLPVEGGLCHFKRDFFSRRFGDGVNGRQRPFKLSYVRVDLAGYVAGDIFADLESAQMRLFLDDGDACLVGGRIDSRHQAPVEPAD